MGQGSRHAGVLDEVWRSVRGKLGLPDPIARSIETLLRAFHVEPTPKEAAAVPIGDPSDRAILVSALKAGAQILITGDRDLLVVAKRVSGVRILDPRTFWQEVSKRGGEPAKS